MLTNHTENKGLFDHSQNEAKIDTELIIENVAAEKEWLTLVFSTHSLH